LTVSPMLAADIVTFVPTLLALRGWHLHKHTELEKVVAEVTAFTLRGLGLDAKVTVQKRENTIRRSSTTKRLTRKTVGA
jgi:hypothetical protein